MPAPVQHLNFYFNSTSSIQESGPNPIQFVNFMQNHHNVASTSGNNAFHHYKLDLHADTCCAGSNQLLIEETKHKVNVRAYASSYKPIRNVPIAMVATV